MSNSSPYLFLLFVFFLTATVSYGQKTKIDIQGLTSLSKKDTLILLGKRTEYIVNRPPGPSRADDAAFLLKQTLQKNGYPHASVTWALDIPRNRIILTVNEGVKRHIGKINYIKDSDTFSDEALQKYFLQPLLTSYIPLTNQTIAALDENIESGRKNIETYLHSQGYWLANISSLEVQNHLDGSVDYNIKVQAGPPHTLASPEIQGLPPELEQELRSKLLKFIDLPATTKNIVAINSKIRSSINSKGYQFAEISNDQKISNNSVYPIFDIRLGRRYKLKDVKIQGLEKTRHNRVSSLFTKSQGDFYDGIEIDNQVRRIFATGAFKSFRTETVPHEDGSVDLILKAEEGRARGVDSYLGAGSYEGIIFGASYYDRNFLGSLRNLRLGAEFTSIGILGEASLTDPWLFGRDIKVSPRAYILSREFEGFDKIDAGAGIGIDWKPSDHHEIQIDYTISFVNLTTDGLPLSALGDDEYILQTIGIRNLFDHRDSPVLPRDGHYLEIDTRLGFSSGEDNIGFFRLEAKSGFYESFGDKNTIAFGLRGGVIIPTSDTETLPIDLRFFNGGANSVRSFPERELSETVNSFPLGGESYWVFNAEYIRHFTSIFSGVVFFDAGGLSRNYEDLATTDPEFAAGLGLRLNLPVGPVRLEYGYNLSQDDREPSGALHFTIGARF